MIRKKSLAKAMALTLSVSMLGTSMPGSVSTAAELAGNRDRSSIRDRQLI